MTFAAMAREPPVVENDKVTDSHLTALKVSLVEA
jgi:hypothetical protein